MKNNNIANSTETSSNAQLIKAHWDANTLVIFCDLCISELEVGRCLGTHFTSVGNYGKILWGKKMV